MAGPFQSGIGDGDGQASRNALFRQVADLFLRPGGVAPETAETALLVDVVRQILPEVDKSLRLEAAARIGGLKRPPAALVRLLLDDEPDVFNTLLRNLRLNSSDWWHLFNKYGARARAIAAERTDLPPAILAEVRARGEAEPDSILTAGEQAAVEAMVDEPRAEILAMPPRAAVADDVVADEEFLYASASAAGVGGNHGRTVAPFPPRIVHASEQFTRPVEPPRQTETALVWTFETDRFGRLTRLSPAAETAFGCPASSLIGDNMMALFGVAGAEGEHPLLKALRAGDSVRDLEVTLDRGDGRTWLISANPRFQMGDGGFEGFRGTAIPGGPAPAAVPPAPQPMAERVAQILTLARAMEEPAVEVSISAPEPEPASAAAPARALDADDYESLGRNIDHIADRMFAPADLLDVVLGRVTDGGFPHGFAQGVTQIRAAQEKAAGMAQDMALAMHLFGASRPAQPRVIRLADVIAEAEIAWVTRVEDPTLAFRVTSGLPEINVRADWFLLKYALLRMFAAAFEDGSLDQPFEMGVLVQGGIARLLVPFPAGQMVAQSILRPASVLEAQLAGREPLYLDAAFGLSLAAELVKGMGGHLSAIEDPVLGGFLALQVPLAGAE